MPSFGEELKRERELRAISLREVAEATKVNIRYLEAIEKNDFEDLPGGVFNRGFVRAYAQFIGVDPEAMVNAYLLEEQAQNGQSASTPETVLRGGRSGKPKTRGIEKPGKTAARPRRSALRWGLMGLLLAALVIAAVVVVMVFSDTWATDGRSRERPGAIGTER
jgi:cytoskeletal protein RodZ